MQRVCVVDADVAVLMPFFWCCRMENTVLGDALEGVPEESSEEGEKQNDSKIESADNLDGWFPIELFN